LFNIVKKSLFKHSLSVSVWLLILTLIFSHQHFWFNGMILDMSVSPY
jgi:hypothetical protein